MTRSFLKLSFLFIILGLGACTVTVRAPSMEINSPYIQGGARVVAQQASSNYAGQQQHAAPPAQHVKLAPADECRRRHPGAATGGFRFGANGELQCQTGTTQQQQPMPPGQRFYPMQQQQQQAAPARTGGYECRFLRGQTCY